MYLSEKDRKGKYQEYLEDVSIAISELTKMKLYPVEGNIVCDLYAIPSHNYPTYYAIIYEKNDGYEMLYAKPQSYEPITHGVIKMYTFKNAKKVENHPVKDGKIIMGIKHLSKDFVDEIKEIVENFPTLKSTKGSLGSMIDGYFQVIRIYKNNTVTDKLMFNDAKELVFSTKKDHLSGVLDELYIKVGKIIE